jgi:hypothetical protein
MDCPLLLYTQLLQRLGCRSEVSRTEKSHRSSQRSRMAEKLAYATGFSMCLGFRMISLWCHPEYHPLLGGLKARPRRT